MFKRKVGMIGLGNWGKNIYRNLNEFNVLELVYDKNLKNLYLNTLTKNKITQDINDIFSWSKHLLIADA